MIEIYRAGTKELEEVAHLFNKYRQWYNQPSDLNGAMAFVKERLEKEESIIFVAVQHKRQVGFVQLYPSFSSISMQRAWILNDLYVIPEARREGVGQELLSASIKLCKETNANSLSLQTAPDNERARRLYEKNGFKLDREFDPYIVYFNH